jgi:hypothetical protein
VADVVEALEAVHSWVFVSYRRTYDVWLSRAIAKLSRDN